MYQSRSKNPPQVDIWEWLTYVLFAGASFLLGVMVYAIGAAFAWPTKRILDHIRRKKAVTEDDGAEGSVEAEPVGQTSSDIASAQAQGIDWDEPEVLVSEVRLVELSKGYVVFRYYEQNGAVKGKLTVTSKALFKAIGKSVLINFDNCPSIAEATKLVRGKGEAILASAKQTARKPKALADDQGAIREVSDAMEMPPYEDAPCFDIPPDLPPHHDYEATASMEPDPWAQFEAPTVVPVQQEVSASKPRPAKGGQKVQVKYQGTLVSFGREERKLDDPVNGERLVRHFCVRIFDENLQAEQPLWGNDLQRVISEGNVKPGDRIELGVVGETAVLVKGKPTKKKVWALVKV